MSRIDVKSLPRDNYEVVALKDDEHGGCRLSISVRERSLTGDAQTKAKWVSGSAGEELAEVDLLYLREARLDLGGQVLAFERARDNGQYIEFLAQPWQGPSKHCTLPRWHMKFEWPGDHGIDFGPGTCEQGYRWVLLGKGDSQPVIAQADLIQFMTDEGAAAEIDPIHVEFRTWLAALLLAPVPDHGQEYKACLQKALTGSWETGRNEVFWPELTGALSYALDVLMPGLTLLSKPLVFRFRGEEAQKPADAMVMFVETARAGKLAEIRLARFLQDSECKTRLFDLAVTLLQQLKDSGGSAPAVLRKYARIGYEGDDKLTGVDEALVLMKKLTAG